MQKIARKMILKKIFKILKKFGIKRTVANIITWYKSFEKEKNVTLKKPMKLGKNLLKVTQNLKEYQVVMATHKDRDGGPVRLLVAGWAMDNMKPRDFIYSTQPLFVLDPMAEIAVIGMIRGRRPVQPVARNALAPWWPRARRVKVFAETQAAFEQSVQARAFIGEAVAEGWIAATRRVALRLFEARALPGLADRDVADQRAIVQAHRNLRGSFTGIRHLWRQGL